MIVVAAGASLTGCVVSDSQPPASLSAKDTYNQKAWPALNTCLGCHGSQPAIDWMAPGTQDGAYQTMFGFQPPVISLDSPESSLVLTMGKHTGPAMEPAAAATVLDWIAEGAARARDHHRHSGGSRPGIAADGRVTNVDLGHGATLHLHGDRVRQRPRARQRRDLDDVREDSRRPPAVRVASARQGRPIVDEVDRYDDIDIDIPAASVQPLLSATFLDFAASDPITINFLALEAP